LCISIVPTNIIEQVKKSRKQLRADLVQQRLAITGSRYRALNEAISRLLIEHFKFLQWMKVGFYWPFQGEFDPLPAVNVLRSLGASAALPVIIEKNRPLKFFEWSPTAKMSNGIFNIPVPVDTDEIKPNAMLIPLIGFDERGYRLGYGGGYYDRTLADMSPPPLKIGVAFELGRLPTITPQPHDIPMDFIVTEAGVYYNHGKGLELVPNASKTAELISSLINTHPITSDHPQTGSMPNRPLTT
jgi:5-formyltetrahydrofolate cyclo-ligase